MVDVTLPVDDTPIFDAAVMYAAAGLAPIPVYAIVDGRCRCERGAACDKPGKHPIGKEWQKRATVDLDGVRDMFRGHRCNIGIALQGKYVLLDADGDAGMDALAALGELPPTFQQQSGRGNGAHLVYAITPWQAKAITDRRLVTANGGGLDVKVRGQFVAAPSLHLSGRRYRVVNAVAPVELPAWLFERIRKPTSVRAMPPAPRTPDATQTMARLRRYLAKVPNAVSGQGGHDQTFVAARKIVGNGLTEAEEYSLLSEWNERCDPPWSERELRHKLDSARAQGRNVGLPDRPRPELRPIAGGAAPVGPAPAPGGGTVAVAAPPAPMLDDWQGRLLWRQTKKGTELQPCPENVALILQLDPRWTGRLWVDTFRQRMIVKDPPWDEHMTRGMGAQIWTDSDATRLQGWLLRYHELDVSRQFADAGAIVAAECSARSSAGEWLRGLEWDGVARLNYWLPRYLGVEDTPYSRAVGRMWLMSGAARGLWPGCEAHHMLVMYGKGGVGKSTAFKILSCGRFSDTPLDIGRKDAMENLPGSLIVEFSELSALRKRDIEAIKGFLTSASDHYRPSYDRHAKDVPRSCIFGGSTNERECLIDQTGNRRFWVVEVKGLDAAALRRDAEQLWAEARVAVEAGRQWHPTREEERLIEDANSDHREVDPWESKTREWIESAKVTETTPEELLGPNVAGMDRAHWTHAHRKRAIAILRAMGFERSTVRDASVECGVRRAWVRRDGEAVTSA